MLATGAGMVFILGGQGAAIGRALSGFDLFAQVNG